MKKTILLSLSPFLFGAIAVQAQAPVNTPATSVSVNKTADKTPIKKENLPEAVQKTLASDNYKGWEFVDAFHVKEEKAEYFEVNLKMLEKTTLVKIDKDGKQID